ncbi:MAG TPA: 6-bladed beta-propeller [Gemmataceae bacterium]|nr:6-bladed beta-propeller [Gemmataceae bacterium]
MQDNFLFPVRQTRRDFLKLAGGATAVLALSGVDSGEARAEPVRFGGDYFTFTLDEAWGTLPKGMRYGFGCAVVVDSQDRIFVTSRSANPCVAIFDKDGKLLETWGKEFSEGIGFTPQQVVDTAHGLYWSKEGNDEFLYWTENVATPKGAPKIGARVYKTDMKGKILYQIGNVDKESATSAKFDFTNPTDVAIAPNSDIYVVDGYGSQLVHRFDKNFKLIKTMGGRGKEHGKFNTCHGIWVSTLKKEPEVYIADRHNDRIEIYSLELEYKRTLPDFQMPCCFYQHKGHLYVPELGARVSIMDEHDKVVTRLGDGKKVDDIRKHPDKFATPHALTVDSSGNLYVIEWVDFGRPRKLRLTPKA